MRNTSASATVTAKRQAGSLTCTGCQLLRGWLHPAREWSRGLRYWWYSIWA